MYFFIFYIYFLETLIWSSSSPHQSIRHHKASKEPHQWCFSSIVWWPGQARPHWAVRGWCIYYMVGWLSNTLIGSSLWCRATKDEHFLAAAWGQQWLTDWLGVWIKKCKQWKHAVIPGRNNMKDLSSSEDDDTLIFILNYWQACCEMQPCHVSDDFTETKVKSWLFEDWKRDQAGFVCNFNEMKWRGMTRPEEGGREHFLTWRKCWNIWDEKKSSQWCLINLKI